MKLKEQITKDILFVCLSSDIPESVRVALVDAAEDRVDTWLREKTAQMRKLIDEWESVMDEGDRTLYTLGLRRAIDILTETSAIDNLEEQRQVTHNTERVDR